MAAVTSDSSGDDAKSLVSAIEAIAKVAEAKTWSPVELQSIESALSHARESAAAVAVAEAAPTQPAVSIARPNKFTTYIVIKDPWTKKKSCPTCKRVL